MRTMCDRLFPEQAVQKHDALHGGHCGPKGKTVTMSSPAFFPVHNHEPSHSARSTDLLGLQKQRSFSTARTFFRHDMNPETLRTFKEHAFQPRWESDSSDRIPHISAHDGRMSMVRLSLVADQTSVARFATIRMHCGIIAKSAMAEIYDGVKRDISFDRSRSSSA